MNNNVVVVTIYFLTLIELFLDPVIAKQNTNVCLNNSQNDQTQECHIAKEDKSKLKSKQKVG